MPHLTPAKSILGRFLGHPVRNVSSPGCNIYLTFDDGPNLEVTPHVLDMLKEFGVKATFFVVADRAKDCPELLIRMMDEGHSIGNHSLDHTYSVFFKGHKAMRTWIEKSEDILKEFRVKSVGFRPPVGIRTPELARSLRDLGIPMILWNQRCYDAVRAFTPEKAQELVERSQAGDIILLHDRQRPEWKENFLVGLRILLEGFKKNNLTIDGL